MKTTTADFKKSLARIRRVAEKGNSDRALSALEKMLTKWPDHATLLIEKARLIQLSEHGELAEAKRALKQAIRADGASPTPWIELGFFRLCVDDQAEDAEKKFDRAIELALRVLSEAVTGKIDAALERIPNASPAESLVEVTSLYELAQFVSEHHTTRDLWGIRELRDRIADLKRRLHAGRKSERNRS